MKFAVLPVKDPRNAKQRLAGLLAARERERLARALFRRTLTKLLATRGLDRVMVTCSAPRILEEARAAGAQTLAESRQDGHSASAERAARECLKRGATRLLLAPIDVPLVEAADFEALLEAAVSAPSPSLIVTPSHEGTGTNALLQSPPGAVPCRFGPDSFRLHCEEARRCRAALRIERPAGLVFDLDTPEDLQELLGRSRGGTIVELLEEMGVPQRL